MTGPVQPAHSMQAARAASLPSRDNTSIGSATLHWGSLASCGFSLQLAPGVLVHADGVDHVGVRHQHLDNARGAAVDAGATNDGQEGGGAL